MKSTAMPKPKVKSSAKIIYLIAYIALIAFLYLGLPDYILYSHGIIRLMPFLLIFFVQSFLLYKLLSAFGISFKFKKLIVALSVLIIGPSFGIYTSIKDESALQKYGLETTGVVSEKWYSYGRNNRGWLLKCTFEVKAKTYKTFNERDNDNRYHIGDSVTIRYNSNFPQQCIIKY